jgi:hypothetical protein
MRELNIVCPACNHKIEDENIIGEEDYAFCTICRKDFKLSDVFPDADKPEITVPEDSISNPPKGVWIYETPDGIVFRATECKPAGVVVALPAILTLTASLGNFYFGGFTASGLFMGIIFLIPTCLCGAFALTMLFSKVEVVTSKESYVFKSVFKKGQKELFDWNSVVKIYERTIKEARVVQNHSYI